MLDVGCSLLEVPISAPTSPFSLLLSPLSRFASNLRHQKGRRKTEINMFAAMPAAQTCPRLAMPALLDQVNEPNPAMAVAPQSKRARPTDRCAVRKSP